MTALGGAGEGGRCRWTSTPWVWTTRRQPSPPPTWEWAPHPSDTWGEGSAAATSPSGRPSLRRSAIPLPVRLALDTEQGVWVLRWDTVENSTPLRHQTLEPPFTPVSPPLASMPPPPPRPHPWPPRPRLPRPPLATPLAMDVPHGRDLPHPWLSSMREPLPPPPPRPGAALATPSLSLERPPLWRPISLQLLLVALGPLRRMLAVGPTGSLPGRASIGCVRSTERNAALGPVSARMDPSAMAITAGTPCIGCVPSTARDANLDQISVRISEWP